MITLTDGQMGDGLERPSPDFLPSGCICYFLFAPICGIIIDEEIFCQKGIYI